MGTKVDAIVVRVVDGDTIRVTIENQEEEEALRILALDTEESHAGGGKPVTPWGKAAKERAERFITAGDNVELEFPGTEPLEECLERYRGNYGRLLVFVYKDGIDFQELMIREGYSPYFMKYGDAAIQENHNKYAEAERLAQSQHIGVWNQIEVNGSEVRNYAALSTWWRLRATIIKEFRAKVESRDDLFNSRLDYNLIKNKAAVGEYAHIFTELRTLKRLGSQKAIIKIGSIHQPFSVIIPDIESSSGVRIANLLRNRYISSDEVHPRSGYAYVSGNLSLYNDSPQIEINDPVQIVDHI